MWSKLPSLDRVRDVSDFGLFQTPSAYTTLQHLVLVNTFSPFEVAEPHQIAPALLPITLHLVCIEDAHSPPVKILPYLVLAPQTELNVTFKPDDRYLDDYNSQRLVDSVRVGMFQAVWPAPAAQDATFKPKWASTRTVRFRAYGKRIDSVQGDAGTGGKAWSAGGEVPSDKIEDDMLSTAQFEFTEAMDDVPEVTALELHISPYLKNGTWVRWPGSRKQFRRLRALTAGGACIVISFLGGACSLDEELCLGLDSVTFCLHDLTGPVKAAFQLCAAANERTGKNIIDPPITIRLPPHCRERRMQL